MPTEARSKNIFELNRRSTKSTENHVNKQNNTKRKKNTATTFYTDNRSSHVEIQTKTANLTQDSEEKNYSLALKKIIHEHDLCVEKICYNIEMYKNNKIENVYTIISAVLKLDYKHVLKEIALENIKSNYTNSKLSLLECLRYQSELIDLIPRGNFESRDLVVDIENMYVKLDSTFKSIDVENAFSSMNSQEVSEVSNLIYNKYVYENRRKVDAMEILNYTTSQHDDWVKSVEEGIVKLMQQMNYNRHVNFYEVFVNWTYLPDEFLDLYYEEDREDLRKSFGKIVDVEKYIKTLENRVKKFTGSVSSNEYLDIQEMLKRATKRLDKMNDRSRDSVRKRKRKLVQKIEHIGDDLERRVVR